MLSTEINRNKADNTKNLSTNTIPIRKPSTTVSVTITQELEADSTIGKKPTVLIKTANSQIDIENSVVKDQCVTSVKITTRRLNLKDVCSECTCNSQPRAERHDFINSLTDFKVSSEDNDIVLTNKEMLHFTDGSGECIPMHNATIATRVGKNNIPSLLDSGAFASCINDKFSAKLEKEKTIIRTENCDCRIFTADNTRHRVKKRVLCNIYIKQRKFEQWCYVITGLQRSLILGIDFLKKNHLCLEFGDDIPGEYIIRSPRKIVMPPLSEVLTGGHILSSISMKGQIGVTENIGKGNKGTYLVQRLLVVPQSEKNVVPMVLFNGSNGTTVIEKGAPMGVFCIRDEEDFLSMDKVNGQNELSTDSLNSLSDSVPEFVSDDPKIVKDNTVAWKMSPDLTCNISESLTSNQVKDMTNVLWRNNVSFYRKGQKLGVTNVYKHRIDLKENYVPKIFPSYKMNPAMRAEMAKILKEQEKQGIIEPFEGETEFASPAFLVEKPRDPVTGKRQYRLVCDFRHVNEQILDQARVFPSAEETLEKLGSLKGKYFSKLDAYSGFSQIALRERNREVTAFNTPEGLWVYKRLPMGMRSAPRSFHFVIERLVKSIPNCQAYVDDLVLASDTWEEHLEDLENIFSIFKKANLKFKAEKCFFGLKAVQFLGFLMNKDGIAPDSDKTEPIKNYPIPTNVKEMRSFNGFSNYFRSFIPNYSLMMRPLYHLTRKKNPFIWTDECQRAFNAIREAIINDVMLVHPDYSKPLVICSDASDYAVGYFLAQETQKGVLKPIAFGGRSLIDAETRYSVTEKELLAIKCALEKFHHYVIGHKFKIFTDHSALLALKSKTDLTGRMARWVELFSRYDYEIFHLAGKLNSVSDCLSRIRYDLTVHEPEQPERPFNPTRKVTFAPINSHKTYMRNEKCENYPILRYKFRSILKGGSGKLNTITATRECIPKDIYSHDELIQIKSMNTNELVTLVNQKVMKNRAMQAWIKEEALQQNGGASSVAMVTRASTRAKTLESKQKEKVRIDTKRARVVTPKPTSGSTIKAKGVERLKKLGPIVEAVKTKRRRQRLKQSLDPMDELMFGGISRETGIPDTIEEFKTLQQNDTFCSALLDYIQTEKLPNDDKKARQILLTQDQFFEHNTILCRIRPRTRNVVIPDQFQIVLPQTCIKGILNTMHVRPSGGHMGTTGLFSVIRDRFFWNGMFEDIKQFVGTCERCKEVKRNRRPIKVPMTLRDKAPRPLGWVSIDAVGPLPETPAPEKYKYIHVLVCHGTRYVVAWPARTLTAREFVLGLYKHFLSWASNPDVIFSDNGSCYASKFTQNFLKACGIKQIFGSPYKPTTQGLVERTNGSIIDSLKCYLKGCQENWEIYLYGCVFALNIREAYSMGMSPFFY